MMIIQPNVTVYYVYVILFTHFQKAGSSESQAISRIQSKGH